MNIANLTIKEIEQFFAAEKPAEEFLAACRADTRVSVGRLLARYEKQLAKAEAERVRLEKMYAYENVARERGRRIVAGVDEAGRGPLAGPVSVAAVILPENCMIPRLNDSKKLSAKVRDELYDEIMARAICVRHVFVEPKIIDEINILQATMHGMYTAIAALEPEPEQVLIDAVHLEQLPMAQQSIVKGDAKSASIAAASIIAKVARDRLMDEYDKQYPEYGFALHKGYGTAEHIAAIRQYGPCPIHRRTFEPIRSLLENN